LTDFAGAALTETRVARIFLIGPPAAGKTVATDYLLSHMLFSSHNLAHYSVELAHRQLCPESLSGDYAYDCDGALILHSPETQVPEALALLASQCRQSSQTGFIAELTHPSVATVFATFFADLLSGSLIIHISAPLGLRLARNEARRCLRVPRSVVEAVGDVLSPAELRYFSSAGAQLISLSNTESIDSFRAKLEQLACSVTCAGRDNTTCVSGKDLT